MPTYKTGKSGYVKINSGRLDIEGWKSNDQSSWDETTNTGSNGFEESIPAVRKASGSFDGSFDIDSFPVPALNGGAEIGLDLYLEDGTLYLFAAKVGIDSFAVTTQVKNAIKFTCSWHTIGAFTINEGA